MRACEDSETLVLDEWKRSHIIGLSERDTICSENVICGHDMEKEIRESIESCVPVSGEVHVLREVGHLDGFCRGSFEV